MPSPTKAIDRPATPPKRRAQREQVGERLAGVLAVRERVDHGDARVRGQLHDRRVGEGARRDGVDVAAEHARHVLHGLALAHADLVPAEVDRAPAEVHHRQLEAHAGAQRGLLEDERQGAAAEALRRGGRLEGEGAVEEGAELGGGEVGDGEEVARHPGEGSSA